jgi:sulfur relay (sulfurtransferase) DsrF/TusC family protein
MTRFISIFDLGYRATVEEQDDTIVWITHMLQKAGTQGALLLRGSAVNYASRHAKSVPVQFGDWTQEHPADLARDLQRFQADGGTVFALREDLAKRAIDTDELIPDVTVVGIDALPGLLSEYDLVFNW